MIRPWEPLTIEQQRIVEHYAGYAHALAYAHRVDLQDADRLDLRQDLCLRLIRMVETYTHDERLHRSIIHGLRMHQRRWIIDRRRQRRLRDVTVWWSEDDDGYPPPPAPPGDADDREEFRMLILDRLGHLTPRQRQALELYLECGCWSEVGRKMCIRGRQEVQKLKSRGLSRLRALACTTPAAASLAT